MTVDYKKRCARIEASDAPGQHHQTIRYGASAADCGDEWFDLQPYYDGRTTTGRVRVGETATRHFFRRRI